MAAARKRQPRKKIGSAELEQSLGYVFAGPALLQLALTHRSHTYEARHGAPPVLLPAHPHQRDQRNAPGTDNEQLEFLGDAVLQLAVTEALVREFPGCSEGELTRLRANLVSRNRLAEVGQAWGLGDLLLLGKSAEFNGGREKPALLANAVEAVLAAVYVDARDAPGSRKRKPLHVVASIVDRVLIVPALDAMRAAVASTDNRGAMRDHKTLLQERAQAGGGAGTLRYVDVDQSGPPHLRRFTIEVRLETAEETTTLATAEGGSKKEAQQRAAEIALAAWSLPGAGEGTTL